MSNQIVISSGAKVRSLEGVITASSGVLSSVPLGGANGVATLDSGGKVPVSQLPSSVVTYLGTWNASTNTPTLANGTGDAGDMYLCNVAGTTNFGAGPITFAVGDWVLYGSGTWQKSNGQNGTVTSVAASITGNAVGLTGSPITTAGTLAFAFAGTSLQYVNGAGNLVTFPSLTGYVPYTGATADVDLGAFKLNAQSLHIKGTAGNGHLGLKHQSASATASANEVSLFADSLGDLSWLNGNLYLSKFITSANTANRSYTFPNANGTVALTSDLANYVDLTTAQTIGGTKTFTDATKNNGGIFLQNASSSSLAGYMNLGGLTNGVKFTSGGGISNTFTLPSTTGYTFTFPDATGTIALTSDLTPYVTLATAQTISGVKTFSTYPLLDAGILIKHATNITASGYTGIGATTTGLILGLAGGGSGSLIFNTTSNNSYTFPNTSGTIALTSDLGSYLPLAGGTLTGPLGGTSATFSANVDITGTGNVLIVRKASNIPNIAFAGASSTFSTIDGDGATLNFRGSNSTIGLSVSNTLVTMGVALSGTNASFSSTLNVGNASSTPQTLTVNGNAAVGGQQAFWLRDDDGFSSNAARRAWAMTANYDTFGSISFKVSNAAGGNPLTAGTTALTIASTGAATFSASIQAGGLISTTVGDTNQALKLSAATGFLQFTPYYDATYGAFINSLNTAASAYLPLTIQGSKISFLQGKVLIGTATSGGSILRILGVPNGSVGLSVGDVYEVDGFLCIKT